MHSWLYSNWDQSVTDDLYKNTTLNDLIAENPVAVYCAIRGLLYDGRLAVLA